MKKYKSVFKEGKLRATSGSEAGIIKLISDFFYGSTVTLKPISDTEYDVYTKKGKSEYFKVIKKKNKFRFEEI